MTIKVLAVEDDKTAGIIYGALAKRYDFEVTVVESCDEALSAVKAMVFDVILMDWQLKGVDGLECTQLIRRMQKKDGRYTPVIAVTAHAMDKHREQCLAAGLDDCLSKPFTGEAGATDPEINAAWENANR